jgi:hypothetical protein
MEHPLSTRTIGRTVVVGSYLVALAAAGRPIWLAVLLGALLLAVWAAPVVLGPARHRTAEIPAPLPAVAPKEAG